MILLHLSKECRNWYYFEVYIFPLFAYTSIAILINLISFSTHYFIDDIYSLLFVVLLYG